MSSGKPIIGSISGEAFDIINDSKCGLVSEAEDYVGLANNIKKFKSLSKELKNEFAENGLKYSKKYLHKKNIFQNLENELLNILNENSLTGGAGYIGSVTANLFLDGDMKYI